MDKTNRDLRLWRLQVAKRLDMTDAASRVRDALRLALRAKNRNAKPRRVGQ